MPDAFYVPDGEDRYLATELTRGPWDPGAQHAGPPSALLGARARAPRRTPSDFQVGRVTFEILAPGPDRPGAVSARVLRPGRRVQLVEAELSDGERGADAGHAPGGCARRRSSCRRARRSRGRRRRPAPSRAATPGSSRPAQEHGYHTAMEVRVRQRRLHGAGAGDRLAADAPAAVAGEEPSPLQRTLVAADVGNGISAALDYRAFLFINVELTVHLERMPEGEWICVDAVTCRSPSGVGDRRVGALRRATAGSAAPLRRCSSAER